MSSRPRVHLYRWLAEYYDEIFGFAAGYLEPARRKILHPLLARAGSACDLACGTGTFALDLAARGIRTFALDLSPGMCRAARANARRKGVPVTVLRGDMRDFRLSQPVDLVTCQFDALNHVPEKRDLERVAQSAARALRPGGWFYFDVNTRLAFETMWKLTWYNETPGVVCVMRSGSDPENDRAWTDVEWFIREGRLWRRHTEHVEEICWSDAEIRAALGGAGFGAIRRWDATRTGISDPMLKRGYRTFWLARKS